MFKGGNSKEVNDQPNKLNRFVDGTNIKGDIVSDSNIRIDGELIGNVTTTAKLVIGTTGKISGDIICLNADIEGTVKGTIKVDGFLLLKSTSKFYGDIVTAKLGVENGAEFNGTCKMTDNGNHKVDKSIEVDKKSVKRG
jgi:cytoskeletal protein CcmA (bactofilin family)